MAGAAQITEQDLRDHIASSGPALRRQYPKLYGFLGGLMGTAPDQFEGSVLDPNTAKVRTGAEYGFPIGSAAQVLPFGAGIAGGKGVASGGKTAQSGVLRLGGREDLIASHGTQANMLLRNGKLPNELLNTSLAVQRDALANPFAQTEQGLTFIPRAGKFDPRTSPSVIHSRDAWTPTFDQSAVSMLERQAQYTGKPIAPADLVEARRLDRYNQRWTKGGEGATSDVTDVVLGNRRYNSFNAFEKSPDANLLDTMATEDWKGASNAERLQTYLARAAEKLAAEGEDVTASDVYARLLGSLPQKLAEAKASGKPFMLGNIDVQKALQEAKQTPRKYAELKNFGPTPLTGDTWAGVLYKPLDLRYNQSVEIDAQNKLLKQLQNRGIYTIQQSPKAAVNFQLATELQRQAR